jgi:ABC-2 type transport system ATP-binding protein
MIVCENVSKYYGAHAAVEDLTFRVAPGEVVGLLGLNGAGKTTLLRILSGLLVPTSGRVKIAGLDMAEFPEAVRGRLGFLPDTPPLYLDMSVWDYLAFVARIKGLRGPLAGPLRAVLQATDLTEVQREIIGTLSHGTRRRVGIAQALVHSPELLLFDEPTAGLDPVQIVHMRRLICGLRGSHTLLVSSHLLGEIQQMCDRIFVLHQGRMTACGDAESLAQQGAAHTTVSLEVRGSAAALSRALGRVPNVQRLRVHSEADGLVLVEVDLLADRREELAQAVVQAGLGLCRLGRVHAELESVFLQLTGAGASGTGLSGTAADGAGSHDTAADGPRSHGAAGDGPESHGTEAARTGSHGSTASGAELPSAAAPEKGLPRPKSAG